MKKLLPFLMLTILASSPFAHADDEVTPLQLKVMQTRKFMKPIKEVAKAVKEDGESIGAHTCMAGKFTEAGKDSEITGTVICLFRPQVRVFTSSSSDIMKISYDLSAPPNDSETTVRMKIMTNWREPKLVTDQETYAKRFKSIGDMIYIEAIPLTPAVQN